MRRVMHIPSELLKSLGDPMVVDDLYSLDEGALESLQPLRALIFLFKWLPGAGEPDATGGTYDNDFPGFFAHQTVNNACATLAVINALGNIPDLPQGPQLKELLEFCTGMDPQTRGMVVTSADWLREGELLKCVVLQQLNIDTIQHTMRSPHQQPFHSMAWV